MWYQNIGSMFFRFVTKIARQTDSQTDRITIPKTAHARSRGKNDLGVWFDEKLLNHTSTMKRRT